MDNGSRGGIWSTVVIVLIIFAGVMGYNRFLKPDKWNLIYIDRFNNVVNAGDYRSREECANSLQLARQNPNMYRPECGSNCEPPETLDGLYRCDETFEL